MGLLEKKLCLLFTTSLLLLGETHGYKEAVAQINTKRPIQIVSERFLSLTIDPVNLLSALPLGSQALNMLNALTPLFLRIGGPSTNRMKFGHATVRDNYTITEFQWSSLNEFAKHTGVNLIVSLNTMQRLHGVWDSTNSLELISFSNKNGYDIVWQLGYSTGSFGGASGSEMGRDAVRLRMILEGFGNYAGSPILAPDFLLDQDSPQTIGEFMDAAATSIAALPLQTKASRLGEDDVIRTLGVSQPEVYSLLLGALPKRGANIPRKPVWITEYEPSGGEMREALSWIRRLGTAARAGYQVVMRQPHPFSLISPTPDFWVSLMYKTLVGREVLDAKLMTANRTRVHVFSHCTRTTGNRNSILDKMWHYEKGAVTVFGVNMGREHVKLVMRASLKEEPLHLYVMTSNDFDQSIPAPVYLNGQLLSLSPNGELPLLSPKVRKPSRSLNVVIHPRSVFFIVMPEAKSRACSADPAPHSHELQELAKKLGLEQREQTVDVDPPAANDESDYDTNTDSVYVNFARSQASDPAPPNHRSNQRTSTLVSRHNDRPVGFEDSPKEDSETVSTKYITFNDNDWFRKFADYLKPAQPAAALRDYRNPETWNITDGYRRIKRSVAKSQGVAAVKPEVFEILNLIEMIMSSNAPSKDASSEGTMYFPGISETIRRKRNAPETITDSQEISDNEQMKLCLENLMFEGEKLVETLELELLRSKGDNPCGALLKDMTQATVTKLMDVNKKSKYYPDDQTLQETKLKGDTDFNNHIDENQATGEDQNINDTTIQMNREIINFIMDLKFDPENEQVDTEGNRIERVLKEILRRTSDTELTKLTGHVTEEYLKSLVAKTIGHGLSEEETVPDNKVTQQSRPNLQEYLSRDNASNKNGTISGDQITLTTLNPFLAENVLDESETIFNRQSTESAGVETTVKPVVHPLPQIEQNKETYKRENWKNIPLETVTDKYNIEENSQTGVLTRPYVVQPDRITDELTNNREQELELSTNNPYSAKINAINEQNKLVDEKTKWINVRKRLQMNPDDKNEVSKEINESISEREYFASASSMRTNSLENQYQRIIQQNSDSQPLLKQSIQFTDKFNENSDSKVVKHTDTTDTSGSTIQELQGEQNMVQPEVTDTTGVVLHNQGLADNEMENKLSKPENFNVAQGTLLQHGFKTNSYDLGKLKSNNIKERIEAFKQRLAESREKLRNAKSRNERQSKLDLYTNSKLGIPSVLSDSSFIGKPRLKRQTFITEQESPFEDKIIEELIVQRTQQPENKRKKYLIPVKDGSKRLFLNNKLYAARVYSLVDKEDPDYAVENYSRWLPINYEDYEDSLIENVPKTIQMPFKPADYSLPRDEENVFPIIILPNTGRSRNKRSITAGKPSMKYVFNGGLFKPLGGINTQNDELITNTISVDIDEDYSDKEDEAKRLVKNLMAGKTSDLYEMAKAYTKIVDKSSGFSPVNGLGNGLDIIQGDSLETEGSPGYEPDEEWLAIEKIPLNTKESKQRQKSIQQSLVSIVFDKLKNVLEILQGMILI